MNRSNHLRAVPRCDIHELDCECPSCEPYTPSESSLSEAIWQTWGLLMIGGIIGALLVLAIAGVRPTVDAFLGL